MIGYTILSGPEYGLFDAIYMTMITLTTVGYGETINLEGNTAGRAFTAVLLQLNVRYRTRVALKLIGIDDDAV